MLLFIDRHLVHEVTSPQAFEGLRMTGRKVRAPEKTLAVVDHNVPTTDRTKPNPDPESIEQIKTLAENAREFGIEYYNEFDKRQGVVHVIGPEQGFTLPGTTIVCGDSHTSTHGAFGALAHGIGTSEVEHVLATQTLIQKKAKNMRITVRAPSKPASPRISSCTLGVIGTAGGTGSVIEPRATPSRTSPWRRACPSPTWPSRRGARRHHRPTRSPSRPRAAMSPEGEAWDKAVAY